MSSRITTSEGDCKRKGESLTGEWLLYGSACAIGLLLGRFEAGLLGSIFGGAIVAALFALLTKRYPLRCAMIFLVTYALSTNYFGWKRQQEWPNYPPYYGISEYLLLMVVYDFFAIVFGAYIAFIIQEHKRRRKAKERPI